jgi:hypothetical protein
MSAVTVRAAIAAAPRVTRDGQAAGLHLLLHVDGCRTGVLATQRYAGLGAQQFAERDARRLKPGDRITVHCAGFGADADGRLRLFGVDLVCHHVPEAA